MYEEVVVAYKKYAPKIKHHWYKTGFLTNPNLVKEAKDYGHADLLISSEEVVRKIYHGDSNIDEKLQEFTTALGKFTGRTGTCFGRKWIWNDPRLTQGGQVHIWFDEYVVPFHAVFGTVGRIVQAQLGGPGGGERNWQKVKHVWDGKRANLSTERVEKEVKIYEGHRRDMALLTEDPNEMPLHRLWTAAEVAYDLGLEKYGIQIDMDADQTVEFKCFKEDWEEEAIKGKLGLHEFKLLQKYKGMNFYDDDDEKIYKVISSNLD